MQWRTKPQHGQSPTTYNDSKLHTGRQHRPEHFPCSLRGKKERQTQTVKAIEWTDNA